jgi:hypothetical protein
MPIQPAFDGLELHLWPFKISEVDARPFNRDETLKAALKPNYQ